MKKCLAAMLFCTFLFQNTAALCEANDQEATLLYAMFPSVYGYSANNFVNSDEPEPSLRELSELVIYPDEEKDAQIEVSSAGSFDLNVLSNNRGFMSFGGTEGWAYVNAGCYPHHDDLRENLYLYIGLCAQGQGKGIIGTPVLVIRLKNRDKTKPISIKKLEIRIYGQKRYTFYNPVQENGNCLFYLGNTGKQLLQDMVKVYKKNPEPAIFFDIYFDPFYFTGSDLTDYPASIVDYLKSGEPYEAVDGLDYNFPLTDIATNLVELYEYIDADLLQNADTQHNATVGDIVE